MDSNAHRTQTQHGSEPSYSLINAQTALPSSVVATAGWRSFLARGPQDNQSSPAAKSSTNPEAEQGQSADFYQLGVLADAAGENETMNMVPPDGTTWPASRMLIDDSSLRCMLPGAGIGPSNQRLSLTLSDTTSLQDRLQQLEFHQQQQPNFDLKNEDAMPHQVNMREDLPSKSFYIIQLQQQQQQQHPLVQGHFFSQHASTSASSALCSSPSQQLRDSKYLGPVQELLKEFCSLEVENSSGRGRNQMQRQIEDTSSSSPTAERSRSLVHLELVELKKRMARLVTILEELDARYRRYRDQMRALVSSFESAAGKGAATVYTMLASRAMSRHFRCLRDGIVGQVSGTKKAIGEDPAAAGTTSGETPRLRLLDHYIRQQKAFQQAGIMEAHPWRPQRGLPERSVSVLRAWLFEHFLHPYPTDVDKHILARQTGLSRSQVCNWFINARVRLWKPMVEEMYLEEAKEQDQRSTDGSLAQDCSRQASQGKLSSHGGTSGQPQADQDDKRLEGVQIGRNHAAGSLTSVVNGSSHTLEQALILEAGYPAGQQHPHQHQHQLHQQVPRALENFDVVDMDFSAYNDDCGGQESFQHGVSLTLGLQQHDGAGVGLSFSPATQSNLFSSKEPNGSYPMQFSILDGDVQNLPYRNLMGAHLLHDLSG